MPFIIDEVSRAYRSVYLVCPLTDDGANGVTVSRRLDYLHLKRYLLENDGSRWR